MRRIMLPAATMMMAVGVAAQSACAGHEVIYCTIPGHPKAMVPFGPALSEKLEFERFVRAVGSPDGQRWLLLAYTTGLSSQNYALIMFDGVAASTVVRNDVLAPWTTNPESTVSIGLRIAINDNGQFVFSSATAGPATANEYVVKFDGTAFSIVSQEGQPAPGGGIWDWGLSSACILSDGTVGHAGQVSGAGAQVVLGGAVVAQANLTLLSNQPLGQAHMFSQISQDRFGVSADGAHRIIQCDLNGNNTVDEVIAVNNSVVVHEGMMLPGMASTVHPDFTHVSMAHGGDWMVGGSMFDGGDFVVRNSALVARTGGSIVTGSAEMFDDTYFETGFRWRGGNGVGDYIIGGDTNGASIALVLNGERVVARSGDMVDLNGNGQDDDDAFIRSLPLDSGFLTNDRLLYFAAYMENSAGIEIGQAFLRVDASVEPCAADTNGDDVVDVNDLLQVVVHWGPCPGPCPPSCEGDIVPSTAGDCVVNVNDLLQVITTWGPCP